MSSVFRLSEACHRHSNPFLSSHAVRYLSTASAIQRGIRRSRQSGKSPIAPVHGTEARFQENGRQNGRQNWNQQYLRERGHAPSIDAFQKQHQGKGRGRVKSTLRRSQSLFASGMNHDKSSFQERLSEIKSRILSSTTDSDNNRPRGGTTHPEYLGSHRSATTNRDGESLRDTHTRETEPNSTRADRFKQRSFDKVSAAPRVLPYTTSASEFLYGTSVVESALASNRRKIYKLYVYSEEESLRGSQHEKLIKLATRQGIEVKRVSGASWISLLDKMSNGRPHNGCCLEVSPLRRPTVLKLQSPAQASPGESRGFLYEAENMSAEERQVNGDENFVHLQTKYRRQPIVLLLDGVVDLGNLGGILRTAHFLGVDAVAISKSCGPLNPIALKASAGAAEIVPLLTVGNTTGFIEGSKAAGWKVFASVPPLAKGRKREQAERIQPNLMLDDLQSPLQESPCILMIGGEGEGLKKDLIKRADATLSIQGYRAVTSAVDSLNVSVAAGLLLEKFLRAPSAGKTGDSGLW